jgi:sulfite exporter TauE/SafE
MLAFGLGTLPNLLLAGMLLKRLRDVVRNQRRAPRGLDWWCWLLACMGVVNATSLGSRLWQGIVCHV